MDAGIPCLRTWRQRKGVSLETIAASTKLSIGQLEAIECGNFRKLPGGIYNTNYIRQYARAVDFDEFELLDFYNRSFLGKPRDERPARDSSSQTRPLLFQHQASDDIS